MVDDAVYGGGRGHRIFEDLVPFTKCQRQSENGVNAAV